MAILSFFVWFAILAIASIPFDVSVDATVISAAIMALCTAVYFKK